MSVPILPYNNPSNPVINPPGINPNEPLLLDPLPFLSALPVPIPNFSKWFEPLFPTPKTPQPMEKGKPQTPASDNLTPGALFGGTGGKSNARDVMIYAGAALLAIIGITAALR